MSKIALLSYLSLQLILLVQWTRRGAYRTRVSILAAAFGLLDAMLILGLSLLEHSRSTRPSTLLQVYILISLLCDAARARTLWLMGMPDLIAGIFTAAVVVKFFMGSLESTEKRRILKTEYKKLTVESTSGVLNVSIFWWLNRLLRSGARNIFTLDDLEDVKQQFNSHALHKALDVSWSKGMQFSTSSRQTLLTWYSRPSATQCLPLCRAQNIPLADFCWCFPTTIYDGFQLHTAIPDEYYSGLAEPREHRWEGQWLWLNRSICHRISWNRCKLTTYPKTEDWR